ncbi:hypothetical protein CYMTET_46569 [Cymbomonas tetramitiformis]|uniref:C2 domain-containing protein n=1 Tax=Cymbomonas tetramitiformis TaxID=36881 RepID=A0AAE0BVW8_9CHLO|nr:hypothetical protein CYMTET_46569 [Cymbomonas tetramitiformis]
MRNFELCPSNSGRCEAYGLGARMQATGVTVVLEEGRNFKTKSTLGAKCYLVGEGSAQTLKFVPNHKSAPVWSETRTFPCPEPDTSTLVIECTEKSLIGAKSAGKAEFKIGDLMDKPSIFRIWFPLLNSLGRPAGPEICVSLQYDGPPRPIAEQRTRELPGESPEIQPAGGSFTGMDAGATSSSLAQQAVASKGASKMLDQQANGGRSRWAAPVATGAALALAANGNSKPPAKDASVEEKPQKFDLPTPGYDAPPVPVPLDYGNEGTVSRVTVMVGRGRGIPETKSATCYVALSGALEMTSTLSNHGGSPYWYRAC